jgi:hypothetical protein
MNQQQTTRLNAFWQDVEAHKALNPSLPESALVILKSVALDALLAAQDIEQIEIGVNDANN